MSEYSGGAAQLRRTSQVNVQCLIVDNQEPFLFLARRNVAWTSVESILCYRNDLVCTPILRSWWHLGQAAICVAGELKLASATTFTGVPHLQRHNATSLAMLPPATTSLRRGLYACNPAVSPSAIALLRS